MLLFFQMERSTLPTFLHGTTVCRAIEKTVIHTTSGAVKKAKVLAVRQQIDQQPKQPPAELLIEDPDNGRHRIINPAQAVGSYTVRVPYPLVDIGLIRLVHQARPLYLLLAVIL